MTASRNLVLTLIALQIATLSLLMFFVFNAPAGDDSTRRTLITVNGSADTRTVATADLKTELRAIVRSEIAALNSIPGTSPAEAQPAAADRALSENELELGMQAAAASGSVIRQAIAAGVWTNADSQALMEHIGKVSPQQRLGLVEEFYAAINRQELELKDYPPL